MADETPKPQPPPESPEPTHVAPKLPRHAEPVEGSRAAGTPTAMPASKREEQADAGREDASRRQHEMRNPATVGAAARGVGPPQPRDPATISPSRLHGTAHVLRQDEGLGPDDVVELTIRPGNPDGWQDVALDGGLTALREAVQRAGAVGKGLSLVVGHSQYVGPDVVRELQAASVPSRLVRRGR